MINGNFITVTFGNDCVGICIVIIGAHLTQPFLMGT